MKKLLSAVLILLLAGTPAVAQGQGSDTPDNVARSDWRRVVAIEPKTTIRLIVVGDAQVEREFVSANGAGLTVLNLSLPSLPGRVKHVLKNTAAVAGIAVDVSREDSDAPPAAGIMLAVAGFYVAPLIRSEKTLWEHPARRP